MKKHIGIVGCGKRAAVGLLAAALLSVPVWAATYNGIDIYHGDGNVNFSAVKTSGHGDFVYLKASQGTGYRDPMRATYAAEAQAASIPFGYYHYFLPDEDGAAQADFFWNIIKNTGYTLVPSVDVEEVKDSNGVKYSPALIQSALRAFVDRFYALSGQKPMIYASTSYVNENIGSGFTDCLLWQADYRGYAGSTAGWGNSHAVWQYGGGYVAGAGNDVDLDTADSRIFTGTPSADQPASPYPYIIPVVRGNFDRRAVRTSASWSARIVGHISVGDNYDIIGPTNSKGWVQIGLCGRAIGYVSAYVF